MISAWGVSADEAPAPIQVFSGGRNFASFEAYRSGTPTKFENALIAASAAPVSDVLGIGLPLDQVLQDFEGSSAAAEPVKTRGALQKAIEQAIDGKEGPLLFVADGNRVRIMELKPDNSSGDNPGTKP